MSLLQDYTVERLEGLIDAINSELGPLLQASKTDGPCGVRAGIIHDLQRERALYIIELGNRP